MAQKTTIQEYVVRLGAEVDNQGINQIASLLDSNKLKALGLMGALSAATTAVYKFIESATKEELQLQSLAKAQHKSVEGLRAQNEALSAMGMTLKEINKDEDLKRIYNDIKKTNEEMKLPNLTASLKTVNNLRGAFWKLRSTVSYAIQWINAKALANLDGMLNQITGSLNDISKWVRNNLQQITDRVSGVITGFAQGIWTIVQGIGKIGGLINQLPDGVKAVGGTITGLIMLLKSGPIGQILYLIEKIGEVRQDYEVWKWNKENGYDPSEGVALPGIWEILDADDMTVPEKVHDILDRLFGAFNEGIRDFIKNTDALDISSWMEGETGLAAQIINGISTWLTSTREGQDGAISTPLLDFIFNIFDSALSVEGAVGRLVSQLVGKFVSLINIEEIEGELFSNDDLTGMFDGSNSITNGAFSGLVTFLLFGKNPIAGIAGGIAGMFKTAKLEAMRQIAKDNKLTDDDGAKLLSEEDLSKMLFDTKDQDGNPLSDQVWSQMFSGLVIDGEEIFNGLAFVIKNALVGVNDLGSRIFTLITEIIAKGIGNFTGSEDDVTNNIVTALEGENGNLILGGITAGVATWIATGNFGVGLIGGVIDAIVKAADEAEKGDKSLWTVLQEKAESLKETALKIWYGPFMEDGKTRNEDLGLASVVNNLLWGAEDDFSIETMDVIDRNGKKIKTEVEKHGGLLSWLLGYDTISAKDQETVHVEGALEGIWNGLKEQITETFNGLFGEDGTLSNLLSEDSAFMTFINKLFAEDGGIMTAVKGILGPLQNWWNSDVMPWLEGAAMDIYTTIYNALPGIFKQGLPNPNTTNVDQDDDGNVHLESTEGGSKTLTAKELEGIDPEFIKFLSMTGDYFSVTSDGKSWATNGSDDIKAKKDGFTYSLYGVLSNILNPTNVFSKGNLSGLKGLTADELYSLFLGDDALKKYYEDQNKDKQKSEDNSGSGSGSEKQEPENQLTEEEKLEQETSRFQRRKKERKNDESDQVTAPTETVTNTAPTSGEIKLPKGAVIVANAGMSDSGLGAYSRYGKRDVSFNDTDADNIIKTKLYNTDDDQNKNVIATVEELKALKAALEDVTKTLLADSQKLSEALTELREKVENATTEVYNFTSAVVESTGYVQQFTQSVYDLTVMIDGNLTTSITKLIALIDETLTESITKLMELIDVTLTESLNNLMTLIDETLTTSINTLMELIDNTLTTSINGVITILDESVAPQLEDAATKLETLNTTYDTSNDKLTSLTSAYETSTTALSTLTSGYTDSKTKLSSLTTAVDTGTGKIKDLNSAVGSLSKKMNDFKMPTISVDGINSAFNSVKNKANSLANALSDAAYKINHLDLSPPGKAMGGRLDHAQIVEAGEDGTEYIIPITKPERAHTLINQMLLEMGSNAVNRVAMDFGLGTTGTVGYSLASMQSAANNLSQSNTYNITAPVTINVTGSGSPSEIGEAAYNAAERHLIRTLQGVYA